MRFRCFGPVEFWTGQLWKRVPGARPRTLLALLLMNAGVPLTMERLAHELWSGRPPASAPTAIRGYAWKLRRALGDPRGELIETRAGGYELRCDRASIDLFQFLTLTERARTTLLGGAAEESRETLTQALGLWRSGAFPDVLPTDAVVEEVRRLEERRLEATILLSESCLLLGRAGEVLDDLRARVAEHPLREGLWLALMRALHAAGRRTEALDAYRSARALLVAELGVEPGQDLRDLNQALIEGRGPAGRAASVPRQLARGATVFVGRRDLVELLCRQLGGPGGAVVTIEGPGGAGKSELAVHVAQLLAERFPDGQLHLDLQGANVALDPLTPAEALGQMLRALGADPRYLPPGIAEAAGLLRSLTAGRQILFLLDNAADAAQVRPLLPSRSCAVLITSRGNLATLGGPCHLLGPLRPAESTAMLASLSRAGRVEAEPEQAARIAELSGHLPLALRICAARLAARPTWSLRTLADRLADEQHRLDELAMDDLTVRTTFAVSYRDLECRQVRLFRLLGLLQWPEISLEEAAALSGRPAAACENVLEELFDARLLSSSARPGRYRMHDLVRLFAREEAERHVPPAERRAAITRVLGHHIATGLRASSLLTPFNVRWLTERERVVRHPPAVLNSPAEAIGWLDAERRTLLAAAAQAAALPGREARAAITLAAVLSGPLGVRGHWQDQIALNELALPVARRFGDLIAEARSCAYLAYTYGLRGQVEQALTLLRRAQALWRDSGYTLGQARAVAAFGALAMWQGEVDKGFSLLHQALDTFRFFGERHDEVLVRHQIGVAHTMRGGLDEAIEELRRAGELAERIGDPHGGFFTRFTLARTHRRRGDLAEAVIHFERAFHLARQVGDHYGEPEVLWELGTALRKLGRPESAAPYLDRALGLLTEMGALIPEHVPGLRADPPTALPAPIHHQRRWAVVRGHLRLHPETTF